MIRNGLRDPDSDADRHQNGSWSLGHTSAPHKISSKSVGNFFDNPVNPDRHQNLSPWSLGHALSLQEISSKSVHNFQLSDGQTNRQTDKQTDRSENMTPFFGGGNK